MPTDIEIRAFGAALPAEVEALATEAQREGHDHIRRLANEWADGANRFAQRGERLLGAYDGSSLIGIGGLTVERSRTDWLRMRRFYVYPAYRGHGIGRRIASDLLARAADFTAVVTVHAGSQEASLFWQAMGFSPCLRDSYTHIRSLGG